MISQGCGLIYCKTHVSFLSSGFLEVFTLVQVTRVVASRHQVNYSTVDSSVVGDAGAPTHRREENIS
jgi:hypothetical protein